MEISLSKVIVFFGLQPLFNRFCCFFVTWFFEQGKHVLFVCFNSGLTESKNTQLPSILFDLNIWYNFYLRNLYICRKL